MFVSAPRGGAPPLARQRCGAAFNTAPAPYTNTTTKKIKRAYKTRATKLHPDRGGTSEGFAALARAFGVLSDAAKVKSCLSCVVR